MAMNFYSMNLLLEFSRDKLLEIAERIFGNCKKFSNRWVDCDYQNREVSFNYWPEGKLINISFHFLEEPEKTEGEPFPTARELQPGTIAGVRKFREFASELKKYGIGVTYTTEGRRREKLYSKVMQQAGLRQSPDRDYSWEWR